MSKVYTKDIDIYFVDDDEVSHKLPYAFYVAKPKFRWELPEGIVQESFIFEMRTMYAKDYYVKENPVHQCGYMSSGEQETPVTEYECAFDIMHKTTNGITSDDTVTTWHGACEVRLRIFGSDGNEYTTHGVSPKGVTYDFESTNQQNRYWGSRNDGYYFCYDPSIDGGINISNARILFSRSEDADNDPLEYELQVSDTPLFDEGRHYGFFLKKDGLSFDGNETSIETSFDDKSDASKSVFEYGVMYFTRVRAFDGYDYSDWCDVNAFRVVKNSPPECTIISVSKPKTTDANGNYIDADCPNGELEVTFRIDDNNTPYVMAWMLFSLLLDEKEAETLTNADNGVKNTEKEKTVTVTSNNSTSKIDYGKDTCTKFLRATTNESLMRVPTNRDITVTWRTANDINEGVMRGKTDDSVFLYLYANDGNSTGSASYQLSIDNSKIKINLPSGELVGNFRLKGSTGWKNFRYPLLPEEMLRQLIVHNVDEEKDDDEESPGGSEEEKSVGREDANAWLDYHKEYDKEMGYNYIMRTTQEESFSITEYAKYNEFYENYTQCTQTNKNTYTYNENYTYNNENYTYNNENYTYNNENYTYNNENYTYTDAINGIYYRGSGQSTKYTPNDDGTESTDINYATVKVTEADGFVMFCPYCTTLEMLKTLIKVPEKSNGKTVYRLYDTLEDAFTDSEGNQTFDGTPYELVFKCPKCGSIFPMSIKYQKHLEFGARGWYTKDNYSYWHGYNSGARMIDDDALMKSLILTREKDYKVLEEQWKKENGGESAKDEDCPYKWEKALTINYSGEKENTGGKDKSEYNSEVFGLMPKDALVKLDPRPEFDSYIRLVAPEGKCHRDLIYNDGAKLNASLELDYMHDFEKIEASENLDGSTDAGDPGDLSMMALAKQGPWWYQPKIEFHFFEGKDSLSQKNEKGGYPAAASAGGEEEKDGEEDDGGEGETKEELKGRIEYRIISAAGNSVACVVDKDDEDRVMTHVVNRMSCTLDMHFPVMIKRGKNDRYSYAVNDEISKEGSVLEDKCDEIVIEFPYTQSDEGSDYVIFKRNSELDILTSMITRFLSPVFSMDNIFCYSFQVNNNGTVTISSFSSGNTASMNVDVNEKSICVTLYGNPSFDVSNLSSRRYEKFTLEHCDCSCYDAIGVKPFTTYQNAVSIFGDFQSGQSYDGQKATPLLKKGEFPENGDIETDEKSNEYYSKNTQQYYYTERKTVKHKYYAQESPIDNILEDNSTESIDVPGIEKPVTINHRHPSTTHAVGEPLFTCYKDEVDENGYHFKYTPEDYSKTGRIYIRTYHVEPCNPFPLEGYGYRDWITVPIEGKPGRYYKKKVLNMRGDIGQKRKILVELSKNAEIPEGAEVWDYDDKIIIETAIFKPGEKDAPYNERGIYMGTSEPLSHKKKEAEKNADGTEKKEDPPLKYERPDDDDWKNDLLPKTCVVFDYVDISEAMCKNPFTPKGVSPLTHVCPINFFSGIYDGIVDRYGVYVLGGYDLSEDQKLLENNGEGYEKTFAVQDKNSGRKYDVTVNMPNNWKPSAIKSGFTVNKSDSIECISLELTAADIEEGKLYTTKSVDPYARFKKAWQGKIKAPGESMELSQWTVEQFSPSFRGTYSISSRYGYQPEKHVGEYWKEDEDGMYTGKYIPPSSKIVHGIYGDSYASYRLCGKMLRERHIISDKTFSNTDDSYDLLPFLDYRVIGKINNESFPYFSGYPRSEHEGYATRPEPPYPYDRPFRIGGLKMHQRDEFRKNKEKYDKTIEEGGTADEVDMEIEPGAQIDKLATASFNYSFLYLQAEWNGYNRIHWTLDTGKSSFMCLYAKKNVQGTEGSPISIRTKNSYWRDDIVLESGSSTGAWCIKYDSSLSAILDMSDNKDVFDEESHYSFYLQSFSDNNGIITEGAKINSTQFRVYSLAVSPATITGTSYDSWTKILTIYFRFDDAYGRTYDIVGFKYAPNDNNGTNYLTENEFTVPGSGDGTSVLTGELYNLASNVKTDSMQLGGSYITHSVSVNIQSLGITSTADMRVILLSALSLDREGMTLPVFTVKMWANEFLKPVEEQIMSLEGYRSNWKYVETYDETTSTSSGSWEYVEGGIPVMGKIQETQESINDISDAFETWYSKIVRFLQDIGSSTSISGDIDAFESWMKAKGKWNEFYYAYFFKTYLNAHMQDGYPESYAEFAKTSVSNSASFKARTWIANESHDNEYSAWYNERRFDLLYKYRKIMGTAELSSWVRKPSALSEARMAFAEKNKSQYNEYYGIKETSTEDTEDTESTEDTEDTKQTEHVMTDGTALKFIEDCGLQKKFIQYYAQSNTYADTRFLERALIMNTLFGVKTTGVWENENTGAAYAGRYSGWEEGLSEEYASLNISDKYQLFIITMSNSEKKTDIITDFSSKDYPVDESYADECILTDGYELYNYGRTSAFSSFLQSPSGNGTTYSQKWQALNNTLSEQTALLYKCMGVKNRIETDFRRNLIRQGYFCNGFVGNEPYSDNSSYDDHTNTCFRWRVETRQYEGKMNTSIDSSTKSYGSYEDRYNMYYHFQMDFFDTFDSQNGIPMMDIVFIGNDITDDDRILAGIDDATGSAGTTPYENTKTESAVYVPTNESLTVDASDGVSDKDTSTATDLRLTATFGIPKQMMPKAGSNIVLPEPWKQCWNSDSPLTASPDDSNYTVRNIDYKSAYYWRVAPYNIVERPVFDAQLGGFSFPDGYAVLENIFHADEIAYCKKNDYDYTKLIYGVSKCGDSEYDERQYPKWLKNIESPVNAPDTSQYNASTWLNSDAEQRGDVQFITDRPRKIEYETDTTVASNMEIVGYFITNENGCKLDKKLYGKYEKAYDGVFVKDEFGLYQGYHNGNKVWFIGQEYPDTDFADDENKTENSLSWLYYTEASYPDLATAVCDASGKECNVKITASAVEIQSETKVTTPVVTYIQDKIGNFNTQWIPAGTTRMKPYVIRFRNQYIMFTSKRTGTAYNTYGGKTLEYKTSVITMSRGFSSDVFGEEGMCIPRYTVENIGDYVYETVSSGGTSSKITALSLENPCVVAIQEGVWRMYFNAVFFSDGKYYTRIYKADTTDFDYWYDIQKVTVKKGTSEKTGYDQPNITIELNENGTIARYVMFAVSKDHYSEKYANNITSIKLLVSTDGMNFTYKDELNIEGCAYGCKSPCLVRTGGQSVKLYFSMESSDGLASVIVSLAGTENAEGKFTWNEEYYNSTSQVILEKGDADFNNTVRGMGRVFNVNFIDQHYSNPCVMWDYFNGCKVQRMYYNSIESPYLWDNQELTLADKCTEYVIKTDYLDEYNWEYMQVNDIECSYDGGETWTALPEIKGTDDYKQTMYPASPDGKTKIRFRIDKSDVKAAMIKMTPAASLIRCLAQGEWIGFDNASETEATLLPESAELTYSVENYTPVNWIQENELYNNFSNWITENSRNADADNLNDLALEWLAETRNYPRYLWWSRKGAGIYRYVGYDIIEPYSWKEQ